MPKPYPREFRDDVIRVARNREPDVHLKTVAAEPVNGWLPGFHAGWMVGLLIQALVGVGAGVGLRVKRSGCAAAAASRTV